MSAPNSQADKTGHCTMYGTMHPVESPLFYTVQEVCEWFNKQGNGIKKLFAEAGNICIYSHAVDTVGRDKYHNEKVYHTTKAGEVISIDEAFCYDFKTNSWI